MNEHRKHLSTAQYEAEKTLSDAEQKSNEMIGEAEALYDVYMEEMEIGRRRFKKEKEEFSELRKGLSGFLSSRIGQEAYREYIESMGGLTDREILPTRKKKQGGKVVVPKRDLKKELAQIDEKLNPINSITEPSDFNEEDSFDFGDDEIEDMRDLK